ncbi:SulP family inorganic anion transporter [Bacillota bacterium]
MLGNYIEDIKREFTGYGGKKFSKDLMAGLTVAAVALPLALAFGVGSGASAASGLITAIIAGLLIGSLSGASFQISGPTGAMTAILIVLVHKHGLDGIFIATFMAGIMLVLAGIFKLGRIIYFIPSSVITGFTSGIAIIIALGQLDNLFGVTGQGSLAVARLFSYFTGGFNPDLPTLAIGLLVIAIMVLWPKRWNAKFPSSLASLIIVIILNGILKLDVALVGEIPKTLFLSDRLSLASLSVNDLRDFFIPALSIAALAMIESLLCGAAAGKLKKEKLNGDRELVAQGIGNLVIPFFGGVPATAAIARTSVVIKSGSETRLAGIVHAVVLLLSMFLLAPIMSSIPLSALSGVLIVTAWRMNDWENIHYIFDHRFKSGIAKFSITMLATVMLDLTQAIIIGVVFSALLIVVRLTDIDITISEVENKRLEEIGISIPAVPEHIRVAYLTGTIFFMAVEKLKTQLSRLDNTSVLILSMRGVPVLDLSGLQALTELTVNLREAGTMVMLTSVQPKVMKKLEQGGLIDIIGENHVFSSAEYAIVYANEQYLNNN